jgi:UDPglucose 6-dehydrogenase
MVIEFDVVSNPEFLKEGAAIEDFMRPDRVVIGTDNPRTTELIRALYEPFTRNHDRLVVMDIRSAELTKYAANAMLATRISFMNELAAVAERVGADIEKVRIGIGSDPRIGYSFIHPGVGYGGSCFPKDVKALIHSAQHVGHRAELLRAVESVNERQKTVLVEKLRDHFQDQLSGRTFALWGLAFKPNTDDMREAPSLDIIAALLAAGAHVKAHDPQAMGQAQALMPEVAFCADAYLCAEGASALVIVTEWEAFRALDLARIRRLLAQPVVVDLRNIYRPQDMRRQGFIYVSVGRA